VLTVNGPNDTSTGRWIPTTAIDQYFATLATWFGVDSSNLVHRSFRTSAASLVQSRLHLMKSRVLVAVIFLFPLRLFRFISGWLLPAP
jgi:hypothetical protein